MSMFFVPDELMPDARVMEANLKKISREMEAILPAGFAGEAAAANMFAAPVAFMALGAGMAGQAFGMWLSAVSSSLEVAQKLSAVGGAAPASRMPVHEDPVGLAANAAEVPAKRRPAAPPLTTTAAETTSTAPMPAVAEAVARAATIAMRPVPMERPEVVDDLKAISGVGPKLEKVLNGLGIWTYRQIAGLGEAEIGWLDEELGFKGRIVRDGWLKQAGELAAAGN